MSWQPIETAPIDGEVVIVFTPGTYPQVTAAGFCDYTALKHWRAVGERWHYPADVTHWMPLPQPPKED